MRAEPLILSALLALLAGDPSVEALAARLAHLELVHETEHRGEMRADAEVRFRPTRLSTGALEVRLLEDVPPGAYQISLRYGAVAGDVFHFPLSPALTCAECDCPDCPAPPAPDLRMTPLDDPPPLGAGAGWHGRCGVHAFRPLDLQVGEELACRTTRKSLGTRAVTVERGQSPETCPPGTLPLSPEWNVVRRVGPPAEEPGVLCERSEP